MARTAAALLVVAVLAQLLPAAPTDEDAHLTRAIAEKLGADEIRKQPWEKTGGRFGRGSAWTEEHPADGLEEVVLKAVAKRLNGKRERSEKLRARMQEKRRAHEDQLMGMLADRSPRPQAEERRELVSRLG